MKSIAVCGIGARGLLLSLFVAVSLAFLCEAQDPLQLYSLDTTSTWRDYGTGTPFSSLRFCKDRWAWICSLILKSKQPVKITQLVLHWVGDRLDSLAASLYQKKEFEEAVIPIEKNLVSEGAWDSQKQILTFSIEEKIIAVNKYHLFISFSKTIEEKIRQGKFVISEVKSTPCA